jgi:type I restriction enzyme S subunit
MKKPSIKEIFEFLNKSKFKASDGKEKGGFPFYTSSEAQTKFTDKPIYPRGCLVFGTGGKANIHLSSTKFATSADCIIIRPKDTENVKVG